MADLNALTDLQLDVLKHLWRHGEATVNQLTEWLAPERGLSRSTVATIVGRLEKQGILSHRKDAGGFLYAPQVTRIQVRASRVKGLLDSLFGGRSSELVSHLLHENADDGEIEAVKQLLAEAEAKEATP